jgi:hypothetical protein
VWNLLASRRFTAAAFSGACDFCCTGYVRYECLEKPRKESSAEDEKLKTVLRAERERGRFRDYALDLEDLQDLAALQARKSLGIGELSTIVFAKKIRQAAMTDDQNARKLAGSELGHERIQTTPHLLGWLVYRSLVGDSDVDPIISEHELLRPKAGMRKWYRQAFEMAMSARAMDAIANRG